MTDASGFEAFVRRYQDMVFGLAVRMLGDASEAEDVSQTVFLKAFERFDALSGSATAAGWLRTVTTNLCLNHLSRYRARWRLFSQRRRDGEDAQRPEEEQLAAPASQDVDLQRAEEQARLERGLRRLPAHQRAPLVLFHFEQRSYQEIAALLGVSLAKVKTDMHRGTARVEGDFVVVLGSATIEPGAVAERDLVVVAGGLDAPAGFRAGGEQVIVAGGFGPAGSFGAVTPWFRDGLFWGRPFVPDLPWMWMVAALFLLLYVAINIVFAGPVRACTDVLKEKPLSAGLGGLLVLLLIGPVSVILAISVVGLIVIPFLICAVLLAGLVGRVAAARWMGGRLMAEDDPESWRQGTRSVLIGAVLIGAAYLVPVLGFVAWILLGVFGLGAAAAVIVASLQRENPRQPAPAGGAPAEPAGDAAPAGESDPAAAAAAETAAPAPPPVPEAAPDLPAYPRAGFGSRLGALALDVLLLGISGALLNIEDGWLFLLIIVYHVGFWAWKGTTIGGIVCHLRVVRPDGGPVGFTEALVRGLSAIFSVAVAGLGWFWMIWDPGRQTWHDKIAGTIVVRVPEGVTLP